MSDYPRVRASRICLRCEGEKEAGLMLCWPCHRAEKRENAMWDKPYDYSPLIQKRFAAMESV